MKGAATVAIAALALAIGACGGAGDDTANDAPNDEPTTPSTAPVERRTEPVDDTFDVDGVRFHLHCTGAGETTVLLVPGWGAAGDETWSAVQPDLAEQARVCTYDRPGTGTSDAPATDQTFETQAADLSTLLETAGELGPYVVVGHSFGGVEALTFASQHDDDVTGLVLVDTTPTTWPAAVCAVPDDGTEAADSYRQLCEIMHEPSLDTERLDVILAFEQAAAIASLGDLPMTVITADTRTAPGLAPAQLERLNEVWTAGVTSWAALSDGSNVVTVTDTGHNIQLEHPDVVLREVGALLGTT